MAVHGLLLGHEERHPQLWFLAAGSFISGSFDSAHEVGNLTPNDEINRADRTWEWNGKMMGAYIFPADVQLSANYEHRSGDVFARQVRFTGGQTIPAIVLNVEPIGSQRTPNLNLVTFRVEKTFACSDHAEARGATRICTTR